MSRALVHPSTANRRIREESTASRASIGNAVDEDALPRLHWIDNYAKSYAANSIFIEKEQFPQHALEAAIEQGHVLGSKSS